MFNNRTKYSAISSTSLKITAFVVDEDDDDWESRLFVSSSFERFSSSSKLDPCISTGGLIDNSLNSLGGLSILLTVVIILNKK